MEVDDRDLFKIIIKKVKITGTKTNKRELYFQRPKTFLSLYSIFLDIHLKSNV